jgi:hypothetical protein
MNALFTNLLNDEAGFIVSAELVIVATVGVLAMIVGLSEVALNVNSELEDVGSAIGSINQTYTVQGTCGHQGSIGGSKYTDQVDFCDHAGDIVSHNNQPCEQ